MFYFWNRPFFKTAIIIIMTSFFISLVLIPLCIKLSKLFGIVDKPNERKIHNTIMPRIGGLPIFIGFVISLKLFTDFGDQIDLLYLGCFIVFLVGFLDDIFRINAVWKLMSLIASTLILAYFGDIYTKIFEINILNYIITVIWVVGITSAFNALDHMDGLLSIITLSSIFIFFIVALQTGQYKWSIIISALIGSTFAFSLYNFPPAKIFLGDSGSFFLGFTIAELGIMGGWSTNRIKASIIPIIILMIPILDLIFVIIKRIILKETKGIKQIIKHCAKDHLGHRLLNMEFTIKKSLLIVLFVNLTIGLCAVVMRNSKPFEAILMLIVCFNIGLIFVFSTFYFCNKINKY